MKNKELTEIFANTLLEMVLKLQKNPADLETGAFAYNDERAQWEDKIVPAMVAYTESFRKELIKGEENQ